MEDRIVTACLVIIGNEILSGRTKDANLPWIAARLNALGIELCEVRVVPDVTARIVEAVNEVRARYDHVFTTGGIGPTHDDITADAIARAFGVALLRDPRAVALLQAHYQPGQLNEARLRMANIPEGADLIDNPVSRAPGFRIGNVHVMAGVPAIMQAMFDAVAPTLKGGPVVHSRTVTCGLPEGVLAADLAAVEQRHAGVSIGSYPWFRMGATGVSLVLRGIDGAALDRAAADLAAVIRRLGGEPVMEQRASAR
jgi:molybdenum cofactor synthesis domain-containing protein